MDLKTPLMDEDAMLQAKLKRDESVMKKGANDFDTSKGKTDIFVDWDVRKKTDVVFTIIYTFMIGFAFFSGILALIRSGGFYDKVKNLEKCIESNADSSDYIELLTAKNIFESVDIFCMMALLATYLGFAWIVLFQICPALLIKGTLYAIPGVVTLAGILMTFAVNTVEGGTLAMGIIIMLIGIGSVFLIRFCLGDHIDFAAELASHSFEAVDQSPKLYIVAFAGVAIKLFTGVLFLGFIGFGMLGGEFVPDDDKNTALDCKYEKANYIPRYIIYMLLLMFWTVSVVETISGGVISTVVAQWYLEELDEVKLEEERSREALYLCFKLHFGSLAIASLVCTIFIIVAEVVMGLKEWIEKSDQAEGGFKKFIKCVFGCLFCCLINVLERFIQYINTFATPYILIQGKTYCEGSQNALGLLRRNNLSPYSVHRFTTYFIFGTSQIFCFFFAGMTVIAMSNMRDAASDPNALFSGFLFVYILSNIIISQFTAIFNKSVSALYMSYGIAKEVTGNWTNNDQLLYNFVETEYWQTNHRLMKACEATKDEE